MADNNLMINMWQRVTLYCLNHKVPRPMQIISNTVKMKTAFYGCTQYLPEHPQDEPPCPNRLNMDDYQKIVMRFCDIVAENGPACDYANYEFEVKGGRQRTLVRCLKYTDNEVRLGVLNKTVLGL